MRIEQTIFVERDGQRGIILGKGGQTLKWIGEASRTELIDILERPVHLFLHVKVKENWAQDQGPVPGDGTRFRRVNVARTSWSSKTKPMS